MEGDEESKNSDEPAVKRTYRITEWCWRDFCKLTLPPAMQWKWDVLIIWCWVWALWAVLGQYCTGVSRYFQYRVVWSAVNQLGNYVCRQAVRHCWPISWYVRSEYVLFFFFVKMLRRYTLPGKRKSPVERASSVGCNYGSIIANSVH